MEPLYVRNFNDMNGEAGDIWDDTLLNKAYDKAVSSAKDKIKTKSSGPKVELSKKSEKVPWKTGDFCRAVYSSDGLEYEAEILELSGKKCLVRYLGYGNEELVNVKDLLLPHGEEARNQQVMNATKHIQSNEQSLESPHLKMGLPGIPPPPPPHIMEACNDESEALSAMLMSWYMSGYHTGFYQGLIQSKKGGC